MRFSMRFLLCTIFFVYSLFSFALPASIQRVNDTCVKDPSCSFNYDFEEHEVSNVPGLESYIFRCFPLYAEGLLTMNNGDSIYVSQGACEHFYWEASLYTKRGVSNYKSEILAFAGLFFRHMSVNNIERTLSQHGLIKPLSDTASIDIAVQDIHDYLSEFLITITLSSENVTQFKVSYYGG